MYDATYDQLYEDFLAGKQVEGIEFLTVMLDYLRTTGKHWEPASSQLRQHKLFDLLSRDPYTAHSFKRPRGYPGDAGLIDMIYKVDPGIPSDDFGTSLFNRTIACGASEAVRQRLNYARDMLSGAVANDESICALACGYLREADPLIGKSLGRFTGVDLDGESLATVRDNHGSTIETIEANVFNWLRLAPREGRSYERVYSLGLTDYLNERQLLLFTKLAAGILEPGGKLLLANFHDHRWSAYMEAAMDWYLIYRTEEDMARNATEAGLQYRIFRDSTGYILYCEMWK